jgi:hypothetical protein
MEKSIIQQKNLHELRTLVNSKITKEESHILPRSQVFHVFPWQ